MPQTTPNIKVSAVRDLGGEVVLHGDDYDSAYEHAQSIVRERNLAFVHPFDDPDVIAGQGTIAVEILRQSRGELDAIFVPVGGGGLIAGIAVYAKYLNPEDQDHRRRAGGCRGHARLAAREEARDARARRHLRRRRRGARRSARKPSACAASTSTKSCWSTPTKSAPASRTSSRTRARSSKPRARSRSPGIKKYCALNHWQDKRIVAMNSGANMNFDQLRYVAERSDVGQAREALLAVEIPEQPGSFLQFLRNPRVSAPSPNSTTATARRSARRSSSASRIARGREERDEVIASLRAAGYGVTDMTDNEIAKLHVRYMVGGHVERQRRQRATLSIRISGTQRRAAEIPAGRGHALEHHAVPLPQPWFRLRARARRHRRAGVRHQLNSSITSTCCTIPTATRLTIRPTGFFSAPEQIAVAGEHGPATPVCVKCLPPPSSGLYWCSTTSTRSIGPYKIAKRIAIGIVGGSVLVVGHRHDRAARPRHSSSSRVGLGILGHRIRLGAHLAQEDQGQGAGRGTQLPSQQRRRQERARQDLAD